MDYEKKQIAKEDGRYLIYYHFPETATPDQTAAFEAAETFVVSAPVPAAPTPTPAAGPESPKQSGG